VPLLASGVGLGVTLGQILLVCKELPFSGFAPILIDTADSKSVARKGVLVRVRPGAPGFIKGLLVKIPANAVVAGGIG
jgi:hypothetical protein